MALMVSIITFLLSLLLTNYYPGHRIAQVRVVFEIPSKVVQEHQLFHCDVASPMYLAYIEWFSPLSASRDVNHLMYKVTKQVHKNQDSRRSVSIIKFLSTQSFAASICSPSSVQISYPHIHSTGGL